MRKLLDFCCKAGGTSMGYHMAGYEVTGVDIEPQPNYPFEFFQGDVTELTSRQIRNISARYDAVAASPPCQKYGRAKSLSTRDHPMLIPAVRKILRATGLPYVIENVVGAPLIDPIMLCGSSFGLRVEKHRLFESNVKLEVKGCEHGWQNRHTPYLRIPDGPGSETYSGIVQVQGNGDGTYMRGLPQSVIWSIAMGIDWMTMRELAQAIPPVYTCYIGKQLILT